jgi:hypothetical protein
VAGEVLTAGNEGGKAEASPLLGANPGYATCTTRQIKAALEDLARFEGRACAW